MLSWTSIAQDDEWTQEEWEAVRDSFAVHAIKMLARIDTINMQIDSLKRVNEYYVTFDCDAELLKLVGATREQVSEFRNKFAVTEQSINTTSGTPGEVRSSYFNEIASSMITCLPEFSERFSAMKKKLNDWENRKADVVTASVSHHEVARGDYLKKIAKERYGDWRLWKLIWEANKEGVANANELEESYKKKVTNPDRIYPGQVLKIPSLPE